MKKIYNYNALITNVVDGDTVDAIIDLGFNVNLNVRIRLAGINTPEMKDKDLLIREKAKQAKEFLSNKVLNKNILLDSKGLDKYGRWIGTIHLDEEVINKSLIDSGLAIPYME